MPDPFEAQRDRMVLDQLIGREIRDPRLIEAFRRVPRHLFVPADRQSEAYEDHPVSVGEGQTLSQPYMVALMLQTLQLQPGMKVLEVGTGSGYQAALLADLGMKVYSVERIPSLAESAIRRLMELDIPSVRVRVGDGCLGWPEVAPFDAIVVSAAAPRLPERLVEQLREGGRMVVPIGSGLEQTLIGVERHPGGIRKQAICGCLFVPLIGEEGWKD